MEDTLRWNKRTEKVIAVELQLASDADFSQVVGSSHPMPGQVLSYQSLSTSTSDLDINGLHNTSDCQFASPTFGSGNHARPGVSAQVPDHGTSHGSNTSHNDINWQMLVQLSIWGDRLSKIERLVQTKNVKTPRMSKRSKLFSKKIITDSKTVIQWGEPRLPRVMPLCHPIRLLLFLLC